MKWFKFYAQDYLTDPKMKSLSVEMRQCWVVLLCISTSEEKQGKIKFVKEDEIMKMAGIEEDGQTWHETYGFIKLFEMLEMITIDNALDNGKYNITLINYQKRQGEAMTPYERVKKYREHKKNNDNAPTLSNSFKPLQNVIKNEAIDNDDNENDNARVDKIRIDKNIYIPKPDKSGGQKMTNKNHPYLPLLAYLKEKQGIQTDFTNYPKQLRAVKMILTAKYTEDDIKFVVDEMAKDQYWQDNTFDMMNVFNNMQKYMNRTVRYNKGKKGGKHVAV